MQTSLHSTAMLATSSSWRLRIASSPHPQPLGTAVMWMPATPCFVPWCRQPDETTLYRCAYDEILPSR